jgi:polar amino acid transport system substrate-binding protein
MASSRFQGWRVLMVVAVLLAAFSVTALATAGTKAASLRHLKKDPKIAALVPQAVRSTGVLTVGTDATYPPFESVAPNSHTIVGFDADMAQRIADLMGLKLKMVNTTFDTLIPSLAAGKFDVAMSSIGDTKARQQVVDFVTYYWNSENILVRAGNPKNLATNSLCGASVGVERGSLQQSTMLPALSNTCTQQGKSAINAVVFDNSQEADLALASNRIDAVLSDAVTQIVAAAQSNGQLKTAGPVIRAPNPGGVAIPKGSGLATPIHEAIQKLIRIGDYKTLLKKWDLYAIALRTSVINGAQS